MKWRAGLLHPVGLGVLGCSALLGGLLALAPGLAERSDRAPTVALIGMIAYAAVALVSARWPGRPPALRRLRAARGDIARLLGDADKSVPNDIQPEWDRLPAEALTKLDQEIGPALAQLVERADGLGRHLAIYERVQGTPPDQALVDRLRSICAHQETAVATCVQQIVNAEATLMALLQQTGGPGAVERLRAWVAGLAEIQAELGRALEGILPPDGPVLPEPPVRPDPVPDPTPVPNPVVRDVAIEGAVRAALQHLNKPATLARCELVARLPRTLDAVRKTWGQADGAEPTPLDQSHALREVLVGAIERLRAGDKEATEQALQYHILREEYMLGMATKHIEVRHSISESTLHRRKQEGIRAVANELSMRERLLAQSDDPGSIPPSAESTTRPVRAKLGAWFKRRPSRSNVLLLLGALFFEVLRWASRELLTHAWAGWTIDKIVGQLGSLSVIGLWVIDAVVALPPFLILFIALVLAWGLTAVPRLRASIRTPN